MGGFEKVAHICITERESLILLIIQFFFLKWCSGTRSDIPT